MNSWWAATWCISGNLTTDYLGCLRLLSLLPVLFLIELGKRGCSLPARTSVLAMVYMWLNLYVLMFFFFFSQDKQSGDVNESQHMATLLSSSQRVTGLPPVLQLDSPSIARYSRQLILPELGVKGEKGSKGHHCTFNAWKGRTDTIELSKFDLNSRQTFLMHDIIPTLCIIDAIPFFSYLIL